MRATKLALAAAALAAGTLLLTGCAPADTAGSSGVSGGGTNCDPNGWGPLSGCDSAADSSPEPADAGHEPVEAETAVCDAGGGKLDLDAEKSGPTWDGWQRGTDGDDCPSDNNPESEHEIPAGDQKPGEAPQDTITVTWIVVSIDVTGFQECVIGLRETPEKPSERVSRWITTPEDCEAQQIDAVYRPAGK